MLVRYLRDQNKRPYGCIVAVSPNHIGWALCCPKDRFSKHLGKTIALGRASYGSNVELPCYKKTVVLDALTSMKVRAEKYYRLPISV